MATRFIFTPNSAEPPSANFPQLTQINARPVLAFDATTDETAFWTGVVPQGIASPITAVISYVMAAAVAGTVGFQVQIEAVSAGDATDLDAATSFDAVNNSASTTVPGTAGFPGQISITLTNVDSWAAADYFRLSLNRDADGSAVADTAAGDALVLAVELRDAA